MSGEEEVSVGGVVPRAGGAGQVGVGEEGVGEAQGTPEAAVQLTAGLDQIDP